MSVGMRMESAGTACDNSDCTVLVYDEGECPACGSEGFRVRFGIGLDEVTP